MNLFFLFFWVTVIVDVLMPGVSVNLGWYLLWAILGIMTSK